MKEAGEYIRQLREAKGLTRQQLAAATGTHQNYIWKLEAGRTKRPGAEKISALFAVLEGDLKKFASLLAGGNGAPTRADIEAMWRDEASQMSDEELAAELRKVRQRRTN